MKSDTYRVHLQRDIKPIVKAMYAAVEKGEDPLETVHISSGDKGQICISNTITARFPSVASHSYRSLQ